MKSFIEDYLHNPSAAIAKAAESMAGKRYSSIDEDLIYAQMSSPEFHLYEEIIFTPADSDSKCFAASF